MLIAVIALVSLVLIPVFPPLIIPALIALFYANRARRTLKTIEGRRAESANLVEVGRFFK